MSMVKEMLENPVTEYLHRKASVMRVPLSGTFEVTPICNMNCKMCYVRMSSQEQEAIAPLRTAKEWLELGKEAKERGMLYLLLTGGEPFMHPEFREIMQGLHKMGLLISINSNATMIDEETVEWLKETPPIRINITLYGAEDKTYDCLCGNPKGYTQTTRAIKLLLEAGISVKLNCSLTPFNEEDLPEIVRFAKENNLVLQCTSYMFPPMRRDKAMIGKNERFTPEEAAYQAARYEYLVLGEEKYLECLERKEIIPLQNDNSEYCFEINEEGEEILCRAGKCSFWITWDGRMLPCGMIDLGNAENVFEKNFDEVWKRVTKNIRAIRLPVECKHCNIKKHCKVCAAMALTESGTFSKVPDYRCQMTKSYRTACMILAEEIKRKGGSV